MNARTDFPVNSAATNPANEIDELGEIIATRVLQLLDDAGNRRPVTVLIGKPQPSRGGSGYGCAFQIIGAGAQTTCVGHGSDSIQALRTAMILAGANLRQLNSELGGRLFWKEAAPGEIGLL